MEGFDALRASGRAMRVTGGTVRGIARGLFRKARNKAQLDPSSFSRNWAVSFMKKHMCGYYAASTTRTVSDDDVVARGEEFYLMLQDMSRADPTPTLETTLNLDETCCVVGGQGRRMTWHRINEASVIPLREQMFACTLTIVTSAAGRLVCVGMNWKGATDQVHAKFANGTFPHPLIAQWHQPDSHMHNAETFQQFINVLGNSILDREKHYLLIDKAPQHADVHHPNLEMHDIPANSTHFYQPQDQYVIAQMKQQVQKGWSTEVEEAFMNMEIDDAADDIATTSLPRMRARLYRLVAAAISDFAWGPTVVKSWDRTGILRAVFNAPTQSEIPADVVRAKYETECECGMMRIVTECVCGEAVCAECLPDHLAAWCCTENV